LANVNDPARLGAFLRRRREQLAPAAVGLPPGTRRRTPGLRRDEVAESAAISTNYYERLEQGRGPQPSVAVLRGLARALRLTNDERDHLYLLAGQATPPALDRGGPADPADPSLAYTLQAVGGTTPAFMTDDLGTVVAQNWLNLALFGRLAGAEGREANLIWRWFTSSRWRNFLEPAEQHEGTGLAFVADLRAAVARRGNDRAAVTLVEDLRQASPEFADLWHRYPVSTLYCSTKIVHDPRVGRLDLDCVVLTTPLSQHRLLLLQPVLGTPAKERLELLSTHNPSVVGTVAAT
jgi:transcriptional regulator with XRE-family HTH domain